MSEKSYTFEVMCAQGVVVDWLNDTWVFNTVTEGVLLFTDGSAPRTYKDVCPVRSNTFQITHIISFLENSCLYYSHTRLLVYWSKEQYPVVFSLHAWTLLWWKLHHRSKWTSYRLHWVLQPASRLCRHKLHLWYQRLWTWQLVWHDWSCKLNPSFEKFKHFYIRKIERDEADLAVGVFALSPERCEVCQCIENDFNPRNFYTKYPAKVAPIWNLINLVPPDIWMYIFLSLFWVVIFFLISSKVYTKMGFRSYLGQEEILLVPIRY